MSLVAIAAVLQKFAVATEYPGTGKDTQSFSVSPGFIGSLAGPRAVRPIPGAMFDIPWWLSTQVRDLEDRQSFLTERLKALPPYSLQTNTGTGFHSESSGNQNAPKWVQVDLGREYLISRIALVPASVQSGNVLLEGYGFPVRFRVQASNDPTFATTLFVSDHTQDYYPNPGKFAHQIRDVETRARYVRVTVTRSVTGHDGAFFALGELIVLSGNRNVSAWRPVTSSGAFEA